MNYQFPKIPIYFQNQNNNMQCNLSHLSKHNDMGFFYLKDLVM